METRIGNAYIAGSAVLDLVAATTVFPERGEQQLLNGVPEQRLGGPGLAGAVAVGRQFERSNFIGCLGNDGYAQDIINLAKEQAPSLAMPMVLSGLNTSYTWIVCDKGGERTFMHYPGANAKLDPEVLGKSIESAPNNSLLFIAGVGILKALEGDALLNALRNAKNRGCLVGFSTQNPGLLELGEGKSKIEGALTLADVVVLSNKDISPFLGVPDYKADSAAQIALNSGAKAVLVTMGEDGAIFGYQGTPGQPSNWEKVAGFKVKALDTTGCGDCAGATFALKIWQGLDPRTSAKFSCAAGALVAERGLGAHGAPSHTEIMQFLDRH
jgi:sugar/nucleoside kinase (ribokinase family)